MTSPQIVQFNPEPAVVVVQNVEPAVQVRANIGLVGTGGAVVSSGVEVAVTSPARTWNIPHTFATDPAVTVLDDARKKVIAPTYYTPGVVVVMHDDPRTGSVLLT